MSIIQAIPKSVTTFLNSGKTVLHIPAQQYLRGGSLRLTSSISTTPPKGFASVAAAIRQGRGEVAVAIRNADGTDRFYPGLVSGDMTFAKQYGGTHAPQLADMADFHAYHGHVVDDRIAGYRAARGGGAVEMPNYVPLNSFRGRHYAAIEYAKIGGALAAVGAVGGGIYATGRAIWSPGQ